MISPTINLNCTRNPRETLATDPYARQKAYNARKRQKMLNEGYVVGERKARASDRIPGEKSLVVAIVEQAILDYFILKRSGAVDFRKPTGKWKARKQGGSSFQNMQPSDVSGLLEFIQRDVPTLFDIADVNLPGSLVWDGILRLEKSGRWKGMFSKGVSGLVNLRQDVEAA
jgi:hypothetical protein